jgi:hypothetical protein
MFGEFFGNMINTFVLIWTAPSTEVALMHWKMWVFYTVVACMTFYVPYGALTMVFNVKSKWLTKAFQSVLMVNFILALAPIAMGPAIIVGLGWGGWKIYKIARPTNQWGSRDRQVQRRGEGRLRWDNEE